MRPFLEEELGGPTKKARTQCVQFYSDQKTLTLARPNYDMRDFYFDRVLDTESEQ